MATIERAAAAGHAGRLLPTRNVVARCAQFLAWHANRALPISAPEAFPRELF